MKSHFKKISKHAPSIFQGRLDFDISASGFSLSSEHAVERHIFRILGIILVVLVSGYIYFVSASVLNVIARKEALTHIGKVQSVIGIAEKQHFILSQGVTPDSDASLGLSKVVSTHYVYRPGNVGAVTIARNAI